MLVSQTSNPGVELFSYANACICIDADHVSENTLYSSIGHGKFWVGKGGGGGGEQG